MSGGATAPDADPWTPQRIFGLCGVTRVERRTFSVVVTSTPEQRARWLEEVRSIVSGYFPR